MSKDEEQFDYTSPMQDAAVAMHEMYETLKRAGFTRREALELVAKMMTSSIAEVLGNSDDNDDDDE
jgi:pyrroline-5-carboxylate reductase